MNIRRLEGSQRIRLLPWHYDGPGFRVRQFTLRGERGSCRILAEGTYRSALNPSTYGAPDFLWGARRISPLSVQTREFYVAPCRAVDSNEIQLVCLPATIYRMVIEKMLGTSLSFAAGESDPGFVLDQLDALPADMPLGEALEKMNPEIRAKAKTEWLVEPCDVADLDEGCDLLLRKEGEKQHTRYHLKFGKPSAVRPSEELCRNIERLQDSEFDVLPVLEREYGKFDMELYLEGCRRNKTFVSNRHIDQLKQI